MPQPLKTLVLYLGNPIVRNDQIGLIVGARLASALSAASDVAVREFSGSPLDLVSEISGCERLIVIDSIATGEKPVGTVVLLSESELSASRGDFYPHGLNLPEAIALSRRMQLPFPASLHLIGIEVGKDFTFADRPSPQLAAQADRIFREVRAIVTGLLG